MSAVLEALAAELDAQQATSSAPMAERLEAVVRAARKIDAQRRRRTRSAAGT